MNGKLIAAAVIAGLTGAAAGFVLANTLNRSTINALKAQIDQRQAAASNSTQNAPSANSAPMLAPEELRARIAEADANPNDFQFQKELGRGLYRFGMMSKDAKIIADAKRLLERATKLNPKDYEVLVDLGNANFDIGYFEKDSKSLAESRRIYGEALRINPNDADVQTDIALTYYVESPQDLGRSIAELEKALTANPKQERALQFLASSQIGTGNFDAAAKTVERLRATNPRNTYLERLNRQIESRTYEPIQ